MSSITTYDICHYIRKRMLSLIGNVLVYGNTDAMQVYEDICTLKQHIECVDGYFPPDPNNLTDDEAQELGFGKWSDDSDLRLIPVYLVPFMPPQFSGRHIDEDKDTTIVMSAVDTDSRFGCVSFGVIPSDKKAAS